jgi:hypothetical protein
MNIMTFTDELDVGRLLIWYVPKPLTRSPLKLQKWAVYDSGPTSAGSSPHVKGCFVWPKASPQRTSQPNSRSMFSTFDAIQASMNGWLGVCHNSLGFRRTHDWFSVGGCCGYSGVTRTERLHYHGDTTIMRTKPQVAHAASKVESLEIAELCF